MSTNTRTTRPVAFGALALTAGLALALGPAPAASAHVTASATSTAAGSFTVVTLSVPHGCEGSPTVGNTVTERVATVVYTAIGDGLADGYRDTFELSLKLPDGEAGDVVEFPVLQECTQGSTEWVGDEVPSITLTAAVEGGDHSDATAPDATAPVAATADVDALARVFGIAGLAAGVVGIVIAVLSRRTGKA